MVCVLLQASSKGSQIKIPMAHMGGPQPGTLRGMAKQKVFRNVTADFRLQVSHVLLEAQVKVMEGGAKIVSNTKLASSYWLNNQTQWCFTEGRCGK